VADGWRSVGAWRFSSTTTLEPPEVRLICPVNASVQATGRAKSVPGERSITAAAEIAQNIALRVENPRIAITV
jgi:hypothetical protein